METGKEYSFKTLEEFLNEWENRNKCLLVEFQNQRAIMHVFGVNFSENYQSGDGILFYDDNEQHSAEPNDEFTLVRVLDLNAL